MGEKKATGSLRLELEEYWGRLSAKIFFHEKKIVLSAHFDSIWWLGYERAITDYPKTFRSFITKQVSGWCGCNSKLSLWEENVINKCQQCGCEHENSKHLTRCRDPGRLLQLHNSIETIADVLANADVTSELTDIIRTYLLNQGRRSMADCAQPESKFLAITTDFDSLGWDCFVEGRIPFSFITTIKPMFLRYHPHGSVKIWGLKFIKSLIDLMHKQWLFQNSNMHYVSEGLTANQHDELTTKIRELMKMNCNALLTRHRHFMHINFNILGSSPALARQV